MKIREVINKNTVNLELEAGDRDSVIRELAKMLYDNGLVQDLECFIQSVLEREKICSTYSTSELAVPHGISTSVTKAGLCFGRLTSAIDWDGDQETPVRFVFLIAIPKVEEEAVINRHLEMISSIAVSALREDNLEIWGKVKDTEEFLATLETAEGRENQYGRQ